MIYYMIPSGRILFNILYKYTITVEATTESTSGGLDVLDPLSGLNNVKRVSIVGCRLSNPQQLPKAKNSSTCQSRYITKLSPYSTVKTHSNSPH